MITLYMPIKSTYNYPKQIAYLKVGKIADYAVGTHPASSIEYFLSLLDVSVPCPSANNCFSEIADFSCNTFHALC